MDVTPEHLKVLEVVEKDGDAESLVRWRIPYNKILQLLRTLIQRGWLAYDGKVLRVTKEGKVMLEHPLLRTVPDQASRDPLRASYTAMKDPEAVHLPQDEVEVATWSPR